MMEMNQVSFSYGKTPCLKNINLSLEPGKFYAIIGPNGSGKTTLIKLLARLTTPKSGEILLNGKPYGAFGRKEFARQVALLPQGRNTPNISVADLVSYGRYPYLDASRRLTDADRAAVDSALKATGTAEFAARNLKKLSGGERQRVYLAMLCAQDTPYVLLDEPATHLDAASSFSMMAELGRMRSLGKCVVAVLHDLPMAFRFADEIILMDKGEILSVAPPEETVQSSPLEAVFGVVPVAVTLNGNRMYIFDVK